MSAACAFQQGFITPEVAIAWSWRRLAIAEELRNLCESPGQLPWRGGMKEDQSWWAPVVMQLLLNEVNREKVYGKLWAKFKKKIQAGIFIWLIFFPGISCLNGETCWNKKREKPWTEWLRLPGPEI